MLFTSDKTRKKKKYNHIEEMHMFMQLTTMEDKERERESIEKGEALRKWEKRERGRVQTKEVTRLLISNSKICDFV